MSVVHHARFFRAHMIYAMSLIPGVLLTGIQLCKYTREVKKARAARAYGTRTDATRYARGKSANFVPTREIFFVPYNIEKK